MSARQYDDFASVSAQNPPELRRLLVEGDPAERAWAGWALAIRIGREANPELEDAARRSPTPGVRTLLLVILAGPGERELIEAFAIHDPDDDVRASACRYLALISSKDDDLAAAFLVQRLKSDRSSAVRAEVLGLANDSRLEVPHALVETCVGDEDLRVRTLAASVLLRDSAPDKRMPEVLRMRAIHESDDELGKTLSNAWISRGGISQFLDTVASDASIDVRRTQELLGRIAEADTRSEWPTLRPFAGRDAVTDELIGRLLKVPSVPEALSWLLTIATRPLDRSPDVGDPKTIQQTRAIYAAASTARERLSEILPEVDSGSLSLSDRRQVARLADSMAYQLDEERALAVADDALDLESIPESEQPTYYREYVALLRVLRRIAADGER
jgi:hypothetical protein